MKSLFHLIEHLMSMDEFKLLIEILFFWLTSIQMEKETHGIYIYIIFWKKALSKILMPLQGFTSICCVLYW